MVGAIGLFEADHSLLGHPVQRQVDMRGEFQIGQFSTLGDRLASFSLRAGTGWFGFAIASAKRREEPGCRCRGQYK